MKIYFLIPFVFITLYSIAQGTSSFNTAKNCLYMTAAEREMIYEINRVRNNPTSYLQYLIPLLNEAKKKLNENGMGNKNYSLTFTTSFVDGKENETIDTTWNYANEEEVKALTTLISDLKKSKKLSVLQPDRGIYNAAKKHAADEQAHDWKLLHTGSDGSSPWNRVTSFSRLMAFGNENIAGRYGFATSTQRDIILQLLIDSGIPGYGHRYNLLDPQWTHVACKEETFKKMFWWIQDFGVKKEK